MIYPEPGDRRSIEIVVRMGVRTVAAFFDGYNGKPATPRLRDDLHRSLDDAIDAIHDEIARAGEGDR